MREKIIVALDYDDPERALEVARSLAGRVGWMKVGLTLYAMGGRAVVEELKRLGYRVFVDLKLHDIPHQVAGAVRALAHVGADMLTVHASGGAAMLAAAAQAAAAAKTGGVRPSIVAVTVLTSMDAAGLAAVGVARPPAEQVELLATLARDNGCDGVVCAPSEARAMRALLGPDALVVTPGVRPSWAAADDQARIATPEAALGSGASHLVIGRPITAAPDPVAALERIVEGE
ncbi:MAG: orotidine-5'-phosphate decarboxylase [Anaerosomatales bacterium]|uniref:orotidine-5'-phosphate decarboxylase n=1 Tax=Parvivirga hydrogeniphila TaxID=2939460 RepID=UPI0009CAC251|nr:orotidine-5'-phosphate decarboxylase [Parvivirga hydrogeniphila]MCL4079692.1 orotidine-5'-phosphate decarboxylase [Parvivirga hydrogeniphila]MDI6693128.1 orotidine-5'-phosphate decarboxylase [Anaerosomatales bacterium]GAV31408.1 OMP decarboxylase [Coriobacteriaceae bacterium EMTCatB1]